MLKFKIPASGSSANIVAVEVVRETEQCVFLPSPGRKSGDRRELKRSEWSEYYDSWEQAHAALLQKAREKVDSARNQLANARAFAAKVENMPMPDAPDLNQ